MSGADVDFLDRELRWRTYTTEEALPTTRRVELVGKKEFAAAALDPEYETYVVHVGSVNSDVSPSSSSLELDVHTSRRPQVFGLIAKEAPTKVSDEYVDFAFSPDLVFELMIILSSWSMPTDSSDHPSHPLALQTLFIHKKDGSL